MVTSVLPLAAFAGDDGAWAPAPGGAAVCALVNPCGDVNGSGTVTSSDALVVLKTAVGQEIPIECEVSGSSGGAASLLKTGQTKCYDQSGMEIDCAGSGQDAETKAGVALAYTDNGDGTITDDKTGLVWEKLDDANQAGVAGVHDQNNTYSWIGALDKIALLNKISLGGRTDWRVPNVRELESLKNFGRYQPAITTVFHKDCASGCTSTNCSCTSFATPYWTSTTYQEQNLQLYAWAVSFSDGQTVASSKTTSFYVRAVAGGL